MKLVKPHRSHVRTGLRAKLIELASRTEGASAADLNDTWTMLQIVNNACGLISEGKLVAVGYHDLRRYFTAPADAHRYEEQLPAIRAAKNEARKAREREANARRMAERRANQAKAKKPVTAAVHIRPSPPLKWANEPAKITSETKVTLCKSPEHFGPAARLLHVKPEQIANQLPPLRRGHSL